MTMPLVYRDVGRRNDPYPQWVLDLQGRDGVYVIRSRATGDTLYIGESHTGRLYETMTRHLQRWSGEGSGPTYERSTVEVAVRFTHADESVDEQDRLIARLDPRDNEVIPL